MEQALSNEIAAMRNLNSFKNVKVATSSQYSESLVDISEASFKEKIRIIPYFTPTEMPKVKDTAGDTVAMDAISVTAEHSRFTGGSEVPSKNENTQLIRFSSVLRTESASKPQTLPPIDIPSLPSALAGHLLNRDGQSIQTHSLHQTKACDNQDVTKGLSSETDNRQSSVPSLDKEIGALFSLQLTNMIISEDLLNRSSPGYKSLENTFLELVGSLTFFSFSVHIMGFLMSIQTYSCKQILKYLSFFYGHVTFL